MIYDMQYRDGSNYKKWFRAEIKKEVQGGNEVKMEESGLTEGEFFEHMGWEYCPDYDHNLIEVVGVSNDQITEADIVFSDNSEEEEDFGNNDSEDSYAVDIPHVSRIDSGEWTNLATFKTREEAIAWAMEKLGADENGMISVISSF
jgi:hypothetical protein